MPILYPDMSSVRPPRIFWPLLSLYIVLAVYGITTLLLHLLGNLADSFSMLFLAAPLAALLVGFPAWWLFVGRPRHATVLRGILVGALSSIIAHPVMWLAGIILVWLPIPTPLPPLGLPMEAATQSLSFVSTYTVLSLIFYGWMTLLFGCIMGLLLIYLQRALTHASQRRARRKAEAIQRREMSSIEQIPKVEFAEERAIEDTPNIGRSI